MNWFLKFLSRILPSVYGVGLSPAGDLAARNAWLDHELDAWHGLACCRPQPEAQPELASQLAKVRSWALRASLVPPCAPASPVPGEPACPGWYCNGPRGKA